MGCHTVVFIYNCVVTNFIAFYCYAGHSFIQFLLISQLFVCWISKIFHSHSHFGVLFIRMCMASAFVFLCLVHTISKHIPQIYIYFHPYAHYHFGLCMVSVTFVRATPYALMHNIFVFSILKYSIFFVDKMATMVSTFIYKQIKTNMIWIEEIPFGRFSTRAPFTCIVNFFYVILFWVAISLSLHCRGVCRLHSIRLWLQKPLCFVCVQIAYKSLQIFCFSPYLTQSLYGFIIWPNFFFAAFSYVFMVFHTHFGHIEIDFFAP